ncbi:MAG: ABC transporter ATP-binding protein [Rhodanobacteraceae bacterium]|nr:ABC transporter ATP-binding protein [Rhodanobacteraceae bacterium]
MAKLSVRQLCVRYRDGDVVLRDLSFDLAAGECLAVLGESGSGKSTLARTLIGLLPNGARTNGELRFDGEVLDIAAAARLRGRGIGMVFQDAAASLHPLRRIGVQLSEALRRAQAGRTVSDALGEVGLDASSTFATRYPYELSGGQRQRVMIALALAASPELLIADEVTSALDPLAAREILDVLARLQRDRRLALLFISHDLLAVRHLADRVLLLRHGVVDALVDKAIFLRPRPVITHECCWRQPCVVRHRCWCQEQPCCRYRRSRPTMPNVRRCATLISRCRVAVRSASSVLPAAASRRWRGYCWPCSRDTRARYRSPVLIHLFCRMPPVSRGDGACKSCFRILVWRLIHA